MESTELPIIQSAYDLLVQLTAKVGKLPRNHRYGIGARIEELAHTILQGLIQARYQRDRLAILDGVGIQGEHLRMLLRAARELHLVSFDSQKALLTLLSDIRRQLIAWRNHVIRNEQQQSKSV